MKSKENKVNSVREFFRPTHTKIIYFAILMFFGLFIFLFFGMFGGIDSLFNILIGTGFAIPQVLKFPPILLLIFNIIIPIFAVYTISCIIVFIYEYINKIEELWIKRLAKIVLITSIALFFIFPLAIYKSDGSCWSLFRLCNGDIYHAPYYTIESAWYEGCNILKNIYSCDADKIFDIDTGVDITGDNVTDNLLEVCRMKFNDKTMSIYRCRNFCCGVFSSPCREDKDCTVGGSKWVCDLETHKCKQK